MKNKQKRVKTKISKKDNLKQVNATLFIYVEKFHVIVILTKINVFVNLRKHWGGGGQARQDVTHPQFNPPTGYPKQCINNISDVCYLLPTKSYLFVFGSSFRLRRLLVVVGGCLNRQILNFSSSFG